MKDPYCPVFRINYIMARAEPNETERYLMLLKVKKENHCINHLL